MNRDAKVNLLIGMGHFLSHFYVLCLPPLYVAWKAEFDVSYAMLGVAPMLMSGTTALLQTPVGFLVDRHGARRFLVGGTLLMTLAIAAMGFATDYWQIMVLATISGIGNSVIHPADYAILSGSVNKDRMGQAFALHTFNGNLGFAAAPPVMAALVLAIGWRGGLLLAGTLGIPLVAIILWQSRILTDQTRARPTATAGAAAGGALAGASLLLTRPMMMFFAFFMLSSMAGAGVQNWLITALNQAYAVPLAAASAALTGYMVGATGGTLVGGYVADRIKRHLTFASVLTIASAACILVVALLHLPDTIVIALLFLSGLALGASRTPRDIMVKDASPPGQIGKVFGFVSAGLPLGGALTPIPLGYMIDRGHPELVLIVVAALLLLSLLCAGTARATGRQTQAVAAE